MRTLVIEDEPRMLELLRKGLYEYGFTVLTAADGETGLELAMAHEFDSIVLDIGLPRMDGYALMTALHRRARTTPVLMLTARDSEDDMIRGLDLGADDYLTKPFSFAELVARLHCIARRSPREDDRTIKAAGVSVDLTRRRVTREMQHISLTRHEFQLLACLVRGMGRCVPRQTLMESVWGHDHAVGAGALDVLVNSLRVKLDTPFQTKLIGTVRGAGYVFAGTALQK